MDDIKTGRLLMLEIQVEELESHLETEIKKRKSASQRATRADKQNKALKEEIAKITEDLRMLSQCWNCQDRGNQNSCGKCANSAVMCYTGKEYIWRGFIDET